MKSYVIVDEQGMTVDMGFTDLSTVTEQCAYLNGRHVEHRVVDKIVNGIPYEYPCPRPYKVKQI